MGEGKSGLSTLRVIRSCHHYRTIWWVDISIEFPQDNIQGMAYLSFAMVVGVKCLGVVSHGPETKSLIHKATVNETIFESALQLSLVARIFFSSGYGTWASALSAASSLASIGNVQVQTFLRRHKEKVSKASILGKIFVATSILPVFVLSDIFKLGWTTLVPL